MTCLEKSSCQKLSEVFQICMTHNGFKEKDTVKNTCDGVATALGFIQIGNYIYFNFFISFFQTVLFMWLNPLVPTI